MKRLNLFVCLALVVSLLAACGGAAEPEVVEKEVTRVVQETVLETVKETVVVEGTPQVVEQQVTRVVEVEKIVTATPESEPVPAVGGKLVYLLNSEGDSLDPHRVVGGMVSTVLKYIGASLVTKDPWSGEYIPYLAESWSVSEDGLTWEFKLREDVLFHDGTPFTAHDYVWTFERIMDPKTMSPTAAAILRGVAGVEAVDDYTFRINMAWPNFPLLENLTDPVFMQPQSGAYVERVGEEAYSRNPVGVGPYKFKEWVTGEKIVLERNPDFSWGPVWTRGGAPHIETIEFRIISEYATVLAGLEAEEIDFAPLEIKDVERIRDTGQFQVLEAIHAGVSPDLDINVSKPPFDDIRVRQAFNYAVDRDVIIQVVALGHAQVQQGPISPAVSGYWPGVEYIGYSHNLGKAKSLMKEAGYTYNDAGMLEKDGQPFQLVLKVGANYGEDVRLAAILQEQFKALGVEVEIEQIEFGVLISEAQKGDYFMQIDGWSWPDSSLMYAMFHSSMMGSENVFFVDDPKLDQILEAMVFATSAEANQEAANEAQRYIVEQSFIIPFYTATNYTALSSKVQGAVFSLTGDLLLFDAYIETQ